LSTADCTKVVTWLDELLAVRTSNASLEPTGGTVFIGRIKICPTVGAQTATITDMLPAITHGRFNEFFNIRLFRRRLLIGCGRFNQQLRAEPLVISLIHDAKLVIEIQITQGQQDLFVAPP
jgi:hypothetical protein